MSALAAAAPWEGGPQERQMLQAAMSEAHIVLHGPPDFPFNAEILGVCGVSTENADENKYGWMVADFLQWKLLFHGVGYKVAQNWFSSLDMPEFLAHVDSVDMINDGTLDQVKEDIASLPNNNEDFVTAFLRRLVASAILAVTKKTVLVVMAFVPVTPEQDICVDFGGKKVYLTVERLCKTVNDAVGDAQLPVMLITPSLFSGGWLCRPSLTNVPGSPTLRNMMRIIAKSCGGAFANRFIRAFTERNTPLMTEAQREQVMYDDPMPLHPTKLQTDCLQHLQRQIHETLEQRLSVFAKNHGFILGPDAVQATSSFFDAWMEYGVRQGRPLALWAKRWGSPPPTVANPHRFEFLGEAFGGTKESQLFHLKYLAAIELDTGPGDWTRQVGGITRDLLTGFSERLILGEDDAKRVFDAIEFRSSSMIAAQMIAKAFNLPLPDGVKCRYWHDKMDGVGDEYYRKLQFAFGEAHNLFDQATLLPSEKRHEYKNVRFWRAARWLSAAIALRFENGTRQDIEKFVLTNVARFIAKIREAQNTLLLEHNAVTRAGSNWVAALGLGGEVQPMVVMTAAPDVEVVVESAQDPGLVTKHNQGPAVRSTVLDAHAAPWPAQKSHLASGDNTWKGNSGAKLDETKSVMKPPVVAFAEESSLAQSDMQHAVEDVLEDFGTQPATDNKQSKNQSLTLNAVSTPGVKLEGKELRSTNNTTHLQDAPNKTVMSGGVETKPATSLLTNDQTGDWDRAVDALFLSKADQKKSVTKGVPPDGARRKADAPLASDSAGDNALNTMFPLTDDKKTKKAQATFPKPCENLVELDDKKVLPSELVVEQVAAPNMIGEPVTPSKMVGKQVASSKMAGKQVASSEMALAPKSPVQQPFKQLTESMLAGMSNGGMDGNAMYLAQVLQKAMEIIEQEKAAKSSGHMNSAQVTENTLGPAKPSGNVFEPSTSFAEPRDTTAETSDNSSGLAHGAGKVEDASASLTEGDSTTSSEAFEVSHKTTADHARMASLDARMQSLTIHDRAPTHTSAVGHADEVSGELVKDSASVSMVHPGVAQGTAGPKQTNLAADDFWARAGIQW